MPAWLQRDWCLPFVLALGHFLWQGVLIAVVLAIALRAAKSVTVRYWLSLSALLLMAACPVTTFVWLMPPVQTAEPVATVPIFREAPAPSQPVLPEAPFDAATDVEHVSNVPMPPPTSLPDFNATDVISPPAPVDERSWWERFAPQLTTTYLCGVALMLLRLVFGLWGGRRLRRRVHMIDDPSLLGAMQRQATALGLKLLPVLAYCERVTVPTVVGVLKPMILLPLTLTSGLSPEQMESVLAHELAHLRRYDHLVNLLQRVIESLLFFHPAMWWVSHRIRDEREHCCDDLVVACGAMPLDYAKSLLVVAELSRASQLRRSVAAVSLLATGDQPSNLRQRIARLLGESATPSLRVSPRSLLLAIGIPLIAVIATIQSGASNQQPSRSDKDEQPQATEFSTKLRNGVTVKLVGVGFHPSEKRKWWRADGSPLDKRPYEKFAGNPLYQDESRLADCREFALEIQGLPQDHFVVTRIDGRLRGTSAVVNEMKDGVFITQIKAGQFSDEKTTSLVVGLSVDPLGPAQEISPDGRKLAAVDVPQDAKLLYDLIQPLRVQSRDGGTVLVLKPLAPFLLHQKAEWRLVAIDSDGQETRSTSQSESAQELELIFKLPLARLARFEYRLRPLRHWVTFENVSLQPGKPTHVKVKVESLPDEKPRAGRESPDPALDPTAGLSNSDEETNPTNNANGDLRANPAAAGSGDPRRAQATANAQSAEVKRDAEQQPDRAAEFPETELLRNLVRGGKIDTKTINASITLVASRGAQDAAFARLVLAEFEKSWEGGDRTSQSRRHLLAVLTDIFEAWSSGRWRSQLSRFNADDLPQSVPPQIDVKLEREMLDRVIQHGYA
ncbi:MAG: M56 family metallopeptidase, partial [Planctomycetaceae bacterium]|nr:M56 family metallopeptidase [Planctomycetaceae bacterium]